MTNVYILTEEGRAYTDEGCKYIAGMLKEQFGVTDELMFNMGSDFNIPMVFDKALELNPDSYIIISLADGITSVNPDGIEELRRAIHDFPDKTCWETACMVFEDVKN